MSNALRSEARSAAVLTAGANRAAERVCVEGDRGRFACLNSPELRDGRSSVEAVLPDVVRHWRRQKMFEGKLVANAAANVGRRNIDACNLMGGQTVTAPVHVRTYARIITTPRARGNGRNDVGA